MKDDIKAHAVVRTGRTDENTWYAQLDIIALQSEREAIIAAEMIKMWLESAGARMSVISSC